jgi:carboxymethylenebutenolidase
MMHQKEPAMLLRTPEGDGPDLAPSRRTLLAGSLFTIGYAAALTPVEASAIETDSAGLIIEEPSFKGAGGYALPAYVARPEASGRHPAIVVVNEIFGIHAYIKDTCRRLAKQGFVAIAPDYFDRAGDPSTLTDFNEIRKIVATSDLEQQMGDTGGALAFLAAQPYAAPGKLGITGFCWGGTVVWMACARFPALKAGAAWYGRLVGPADAGRAFPATVAGELKAPVLGLYGGKDQGIPLETVETMRQALAAAGNPSKSEIIVYPESQHGFHADYRPSYDPAAAQDGWDKMLAWFRKHGAA